MSPMDLAAGERVLWEGVPPRGLVLRSMDAFIVPFSLVWTWFVITAVISALSRPSGLSGAPILALMLTTGGYITVGRFVADLWRRRRTRYWVTNQRVVIESGLFRPSTTSMSLQNLPPMVVMEGGDGTGTIKFGETPKRWGLWSAEYQGMYWPGMVIPVQFERIPGVRSVHEVILSAQRDYRS